jgi:hypothetical protein
VRGKYLCMVGGEKYYFQEGVGCYFPTEILTLMIKCASEGVRRVNKPDLLCSTPTEYKSRPPPPHHPVSVRSFLIAEELTL